MAPRPEITLSRCLSTECITSLGWFQRTVENEKKIDKSNNFESEVGRETAQADFWNSKTYLFDVGFHEVDYGAARKWASECKVFGEGIHPLSTISDHKLAVDG